MVERVLAGLRAENVEAANALLSSYGDIRGFGPVKEAAAAKVKAREAELLAAFEAAGTVKETAAA